MDNDISVYRKEHYHFQNFGNMKNSAPSTSDTCSNRYNPRTKQSAKRIYLELFTTLCNNYESGTSLNIGILSKIIKLQCLFVKRFYDTSCHSEKVRLSYL